MLSANCGTSFASSLGTFHSPHQWHWSSWMRQKGEHFEIGWELAEMFYIKLRVELTFFPLRPFPHAFTASPLIRQKSFVDFARALLEWINTQRKKKGEETRKLKISSTKESRGRNLWRWWGRCFMLQHSFLRCWVMEICDAMSLAAGKVPFACSKLSCGCFFRE